jgi:hypothetical protein
LLGVRSRIFLEESNFLGKQGDKVIEQAMPGAIRNIKQISRNIMAE